MIDANDLTVFSVTVDSFNPEQFSERVNSIKNYIKDTLTGVELNQNRKFAPSRLDDITFVITVGTSWGGDDLTDVQIDLTWAGDEEDGPTFDTALRVHNNDCLTMGEQLAMLQVAVEWFEQSGIMPKCGYVVGY